ncbi:MAG: YqeG family HAD IIIA-type phosphatase [bacterium]
MARGKGIVPHWFFNSLEEISLEWLKQKGIKAILLDLDNTIVLGGRNEVPESIKSWIEEAKEKGFKLCIFSNTFKIRRLGRVCKAIGVPYVRGTFKPRRGGLRKALEFLGVNPQESVMIGDRVLTDVFGGNRVGMWTILVKPLRGGRGIMTKLFYHFERFLLRIISKGTYGGSSSSK